MLSSKTALLYQWFSFLIAKPFCISPCGCRFCWKYIIIRIMFLKKVEKHRYQEVNPGPVKNHRPQLKTEILLLLGNSIKTKNQKNFTLEADFELPEHTLKNSISDGFLANALEEQITVWIKFFLHLDAFLQYFLLHYPIEVGFCTLGSRGMHLQPKDLPNASLSFQKPPSALFMMKCISRNISHYDCTPFLCS